MTHEDSKATSRALSEDDRQAAGKVAAGLSGRLGKLTVKAKEQ